MVPSKLIIGDAIKIVSTINGYDPTLYGMQIKFGGPVSGLSLDVAYDNGYWNLNIPSSVTELWTPGIYNWVLMATIFNNTTQSVDRYTIQSGQSEFVLRADLNTETDVRTHARKVLDNIEAVIENRATSDQSAYTINGRSLTRMTIDELIKLRAYYKEIVNKEAANLTNKPASYATQVNIRLL